MPPLPPAALRVLIVSLLAAPTLAVAACEPVPDSATRGMRNGSTSAGNNAAPAGTPATGGANGAARPSTSKATMPSSAGSARTAPTAAAGSGSADAGRLGPIARNATATAQAKLGGQAAAHATSPALSGTSTALGAVASAPRTATPAVGSQHPSGGSSMSGTASAAGSSRTTPTAAAARAGGGGSAVAATAASSLAPARATATNVPLSDPSGYLGHSATLGSPGATGSISAVRYGAHPESGFTRVVWDLSATQMPLVTVTEKSDASGAFIELVFDATSLSASASASLPLALEAGASQVVNEVVLAPDGNTSHLVFQVRLARPARFQVGELDTPWRAVVDVYE